MSEPTWHHGRIVNPPCDHLEEARAAARSMYGPNSAVMAQAHAAVAQAEALQRIAAALERIADQPG